MEEVFEKSLKVAHHLVSHSGNWLSNPSHSIPAKIIKIGVITSQNKNLNMVVPPAWQLSP